jgi:tetratricopeptide (TPR) repeat protein
MYVENWTERWSLAGLLDQAERLERAGDMERSLELLDSAWSSALEARAAEALPAILRRTGNVHLGAGRFDLAEELYEASLAVAQRQHSEAGVAAALCAIGNLAYRTGARHEARRRLEAALEHAPFWDESLHARVYQNLGVIAYAERSTDHARRQWMEALRNYLGVGDRLGQARVYNNLAVSSAERGAWTDAQLYLECALDGARWGADHELEAGVRLNLALVASGQGRPDWAGAELDRARAIREFLAPVSPKELDFGFQVFLAGD